MVDFDERFLNNSNLSAIVEEILCTGELTESPWIFKGSLVGRTESPFNIKE
jgi:hypothetical protein